MKTQDMMYLEVAINHDQLAGQLCKNPDEFALLIGALGRAINPSTAEVIREEIKSFGLETEARTLLTQIFKIF